MLLFPLRLQRRETTVFDKQSASNADDQHQKRKEPQMKFRFFMAMIALVFSVHHASAQEIVVNRAISKGEVLTAQQ